MTDSDTMIGKGPPMVEGVFYNSPSQDYYDKWTNESMDGQINNDLILKYKGLP